jgi:hypothetical protein
MPLRGAASARGSAGRSGRGCPASPTSPVASGGTGRRAAAGARGHHRLRLPQRDRNVAPVPVNVDPVASKPLGREPVPAEQPRVGPRGQLDKFGPVPAEHTGLG